MEETYFTCNLGQAARLGSRLETFKNIPELIEAQAGIHGDLPAVGFYIPGPEWKTEVLTFSKILNGTRSTANRILKALPLPERQNVALICSSNLEFLLTWLALMYLGHAVLLIAPQCTPKAVAELCKQSKVCCIFYDDVHKDLATRSVRAGSEESIHLSLQLVSFHTEREAFDIVKESASSVAAHPDILPTDTAYLHHTSGTSSGIPKPIPQSHRAGAGVQASFDNGPQHATFTTTPLYHGGIADLFRAWTSNALIWLFPSKDIPITATNICRCLETNQILKGAPPVSYFSSVPYVLEMIAAHPQGLRHLQKMEIVGVGGAALPVEIGDGLVREGVKLVSRYGSAECGFLMSSHRDYSQDKEWQYVRPGEGMGSLLRFEEIEGGLFELVVLPGWPHMAKTNRADGSFATSDLFTRHPEILNAWRYHSRADAQLTLVTGKKFDPSPLESSMAASTPLLKGVLIFGNGRPYPGALLFRSVEGQDLSDNELITALSNEVEKLNAETQTHARISRDMLIPQPFCVYPLEKSSKGTVIRSRAEERYAEEINAAYEKVIRVEGQVPDIDVEHKVLEVVRKVMCPLHRSKVLNAEMDLFAYGVDSVACVQIRHAIAHLVPGGGPDLPMTVVQDAGSVRGLANKILDMRHGRGSATEQETDQHQLMQDLVEQYSQIRVPDSSAVYLHTPPPDLRSAGKIVLLTGPTGSIGSHLLSRLLSSPDIGHVHLLLRGASPEVGRERTRKALEFRQLAIPKDFEERTTVHTCALSDAQMGLADETYSMLAETVDVIFHLAWSVDFLLPLRGFKQHFAGLHTLLSISLAHARYAPEPAQLVFCSSIASVSNFQARDQTPEIVLGSPSASGSIGYSQSKWVAENICLRACQSHPELRDSLTIVRVGQVSGDTIHGVWNKSEAYPLMLSSAKATGCLPDLLGESLSWIPVDLAAACFVELCSEGERKTSKPETIEGNCEVRALHVLNQDKQAPWSVLLQSLSRSERFEIVDPTTWLHRLEALRESENQTLKSHPSLKLLDFWKKAYGPSGSSQGNETGGTDQAPRFAMAESVKAMPSLEKVRAVDEADIQRLWAWIDSNM